MALNIIVKNMSSDDDLQKPSSEELNNCYNGVIDYDKKREIKQQAKAEIKKKFIVGQTYYLKSNKIKREYILKKFIYTINETVVNIVIMKQIAGPFNAIYTLNQYDCRRYHIKYEEGLQVFSMQMNWVAKRTKKN